MKNSGIGPSRYLSRLFSWTMLRWWIVGIAFAGVNIAFLYVLVDLMHLPVLAATVLAAEVGTILRFLVNDRWVFGQRRLTWRRLWQYHVANAGSFGIWLATTNLIVLAGVHYMVASLIGMGCSVLLSIATNFLWIWRHKSEAALAGRRSAP